MQTTIIDALTEGKIIQLADSRLAAKVEGDIVRIYEMKQGEWVMTRAFDTACLPLDFERLFFGAQIIQDQPKGDLIAWESHLCNDYCLK